MFWLAPQISSHHDRIHQQPIANRWRWRRRAPGGTMQESPSPTRRRRQDASMDPWDDPKGLGIPIRTWCQRHHVEQIKLRLIGICSLWFFGYTACACFLKICRWFPLRFTSESRLTWTGCAVISGFQRLQSGTQKPSYNGPTPLCSGWNTPIYKAIFWNPITPFKNDGPGTHLVRIAVFVYRFFWSDQKRRCDFQLTVSLSFGTRTFFFSNGVSVTAKFLFSGISEKIYITH